MENGRVGAGVGRGMESEHLMEGDFHAGMMGMFWMWTVVTSV